MRLARLLAPLLLLAPPAAHAAEPPKLKNSYYVVAEKATWPTGHVLEVYVNDRLILIHPDDEEEAVLKINAFLEPGANRVSFKVRKARGAAGGGVHRARFGEGKYDEKVTLSRELKSFTFPNPEAALASEPVTFTPR